MDLNLCDLSLRLGRREVLTGVSADLEPGGVIAILGPNGSGKSSLVRAMAGLLAPAGGAVMLDGQPVTALSPRDRARAIGYLPQDGAVHWGIGVRELVALGRLPHRSPFMPESAEDAAAVEAALAATGSEPLADRRVDQLSGGERARVLLARVLAGTPRWLLADEPLASLDPAHQLAILDQLRAAAARGMGVVVVLHDLILAARAADRVLLLREGRLVAFGAPADVLAPDPLRATFGVEVRMVEDGHGRLLPIPLGRLQTCI